MFFFYNKYKLNLKEAASNKEDLIQVRKSLKHTLWIPKTHAAVLD
jgi:hypothetical protein